MYHALSLSENFTEVIPLTAKKLLYVEIYQNGGFSCDKIK